jgi:hypothetical protein
MYMRLKYNAINPAAVPVFARTVADKCGNPRVFDYEGEIVFVWDGDGANERVHDVRVYATMVEYFRGGLIEVSRGQGEPQ